MSKKSTITQLEQEGYFLTARFINAFYKEARFLANKYGVPQDYKDICQLALIEATKLENVYDSSKGSTFFTFVRRPLRQVIQKLYGYPRSSTNLYNKILKFMNRYYQEHSMMPSMDIIAKGLSTTELNIRSVFYGKPVKISVDSLGADFSLSNESTELTERVQTLLEGLNKDDQDLVIKYYLEEYTIEEIAAISDIPVASVSIALSQALKILKETNG